MSDCNDLRELFSSVIEGTAGDEDASRVRSHLERCAECAELFETMAIVVGTADLMSDLVPPEHLGEELSASPCRRWLGLLYQAIDREISQHNLERLLTHLEACPSCRQAWHDATLIHQVGDAMTPPSHLLTRCIQVRDAVARITILPRRTATAAAYVLALLASIAVGNPAIIAQDLQTAAAEKMTVAASGVSEVAQEGRGELRVALFRAMTWGKTKIDNVRGWVDRLGNDTDDSTGDIDTAPDDTPQGEDP